MSEFICETCGIDESMVNDDVVVKDYNTMFVIYSTGCPKCIVLEKKMQSKNLDYTTETNVQPILDKGYKSVPVLWNRNTDTYMTFTDAINFVNSII